MDLGPGFVLFVLGPRSWIQVSMSRVLGLGLFSIYYKVWQKVITNCESYYNNVKTIARGDVINAKTFDELTKSSELT